MSSSPPSTRHVAVVITTYNHAHFLAAAITSAQEQTVPPHEILVVDDGSDDHPEDVVARFAGVRLIRQANAGLAAARNTGWRAATSDFVVFLDADDRLLPKAIEVNLARLVDDPDAAFSYGGYLRVDAKDGRCEPVAFRPASGFESFLRGNVIGMHATVLYRRERIADVGGFTAGLPACEDYDVYLRTSARFPVVHGPEPVAEYWHHDSNMSRDSALMLAAALKVLRAQRGVADQRSMTRAYRDGVIGWKRYYAGAWWGHARRAIRARRLDRDLVRQGASLVRQAPLTMVSIPCCVMTRRAAAAVRRRRPR